MALAMFNPCRPCCEEECIGISGCLTFNYKRAYECSGCEPRNINIRLTDQFCSQLRDEVGDLNSSFCRSHGEMCNPSGLTIYIGHAGGCILDDITDPDDYVAYNIPVFDSENDNILTLTGVVGTCDNYPETLTVHKSNCGTCDGLLTCEPTSDVLIAQLDSFNSVDRLSRNVGYLTRNGDAYSGNIDYHLNLGSCSGNLNISVSGTIDNNGPSNTPGFPNSNPQFFKTLYNFTDSITGVLTKHYLNPTGYLSTHCVRGDRYVEGMRILPTGNFTYQPCLKALVNANLGELQIHESGYTLPCLGGSDTNFDMPETLYMNFYNIVSCTDAGLPPVQLDFDYDRYAWKGEYNLGVGFSGLIMMSIWQNNLTNNNSTLMIGFNRYGSSTVYLPLSIDSATTCRTPSDNPILESCCPFLTKSFRAAAWHLFLEMDISE